ncbi:MAG TPA: methyltransferase domain-containing protein [Ktedonobacterales bacterium]|nr:methyltransferase domain-containing protein [Ktedonobacterales bacterium]
MTSCQCQCQGIEQIFDSEMASRELRSYQRNGPGRTTQLLVDALRAEGVAGASLLDIGGGVGAIPLGLLASGLRSATDVDASGAYLAVARAEAQRRGYDGQVTYHHGNFVELAHTLESADIVTLDRVICCYHDMPALVKESTAKARRLYGLVYPRDDWWVRLGITAENTFLRVRRQLYRAFVHPVRAVDTIVRDAGFVQRFFHRGAIWQVVVYARH